MGEPPGRTREGERLKILQVTVPEETTPPAKYGGVQWVVAWLCDVLVALGHEVHLVGPEGSHVEGCIHHFVPAGTLEPELAQEALRVADAVGPDIIHDHNNSQLMHRERPELPILMTWHNKSMHRIPWVVFPSESERRRVGAERARVVPHGMVLDPFPFDAEGSDEILFLGALHPRKQVHHVIQAALKVGARLCLAGPVRDDAYFAQHIEPYLGDLVRWIGEIGG